MGKIQAIQHFIEEYSTSKNPTYAFLFAPCKNADLHTHCDFYEFSLITRGSFINDYKGQQETLPNDTLIFFQKDETHAILTDTPMSIHFSFLVESSYFEKQFAEFFPKIPLSSLGSYCKRHLPESQNRFLQDLAIKLCSNENRKYQDQLAYLFMMTALTNLIMPVQSTAPKQENAGNSASYYASVLLERLDSYTYIGDPVNEIYKYDTDDYAYLEAMKAAGYTIVSTVGRFTVQKGLANMMKAAAAALSKEKKMIFVFAGDGEQREELLELSAKYGISKNVVFTGFVRGKQLRDIYQVSDIFVMPSISEPFGLTALEAAHHGDVLILTKQSGVAEVLRSAMEYDFWDTNKLADEICAIAKSKGLRETLQSGLRAEYRQISWDDVAEKLISVYNEVNNHKREF